MPELTVPLVYGTAWCPDCKRAKQFLGEHRIQYDWIDVDQDTDGLKKIEEINDGKQIIPTIVFPDGGVLVEPSNAELAAKLGISTRAERDFYQLVVVGGGPAGLTAALYTAREGIETLVLDRAGLGGQAGVTERLDNFPGFPEGISGAEFADRLKRQAQRFGVETVGAAEVVDIHEEGRYVSVHTADGHEYGAEAVLIATGSTYRRLGVPGEDDLIGAGIHFCATCDAAFYKGADEILVIGGGNSAGEEGLFLTKFARKVTIVTNAAGLTASEVIKQKVAETPAIEVIGDSTVAEFKGRKRVESVVIKNLKTEETRELRPAGVFVFIGLTPNTKFLDAESGIKLDRFGFIETNAMLETSVPGVFAAGDVRLGSTKQAASAAGEGATAALMVRNYLKLRAEEQNVRAA
jgi:thioredoxin reductase (NADPH)